MGSDTFRSVTERHSWNPGEWKVTVNEMSTGVYEITAISASFGTISVTTHDPVSDLAQVRREAEERAVRTDST